MDVSLDPQVHAELVTRAKAQIRRRMRALRGGHTEVAIAARNSNLVARLVDSAPLRNARSVALFWPMEGRREVDLRPLDRELRARGTRIFYPFMDALPQGGFVTGFREVRAIAELQDRGRGFLEPTAAAPPAARGDIDVVVVPALAADLRGHRIGYGAGYYDATLPDVSPPATTMIVVYQFQLMAELPTEAHDVPCTWVVTDESSHEAEPAQT
jgi:5-formyltetrahydrofolate cyclo-ligase